MHSTISGALKFMALEMLFIEESMSLENRLPVSFQNLAISQCFINCLLLA